MISGKTKSGFDFVVDERRAKSWGMVKKIAAMQKAENDLAIYGIAIDLIGELIGEEQEVRLVDHVTAIYGYDDAEAVSKEAFEIIGAARRAPATKNFSSSPDVSQPTRTP